MITAMRQCYACGKAIQEDDQQSYRLLVEFHGNKAIGGFGHSRSIGQDVCSVSCLADIFASIADDLRELRAGMAGRKD